MERSHYKFFVKDNGSNWTDVSTNGNILIVLITIVGKVKVNN